MDLVIAESVIHQDKDGRYSLNDLHRASGGETRHQPAQFLRLAQTEELIHLLKADMGKPISAVRGGKFQGTYACKEIVYAYAMWISPAFNLKVIRTFDKAVTVGVSRDRLRHECASSNKVANEILKITRAEQGKDTAPHHYMNEAKLVNHVISGEFKGLDRDALSAADLDLLAHIETRNAVLIGRGLAYDQRKAMLRQYAMDWRLAHAPALEVG